MKRLLLVAIALVGCKKKSNPIDEVKVDTGERAPAKPVAKPTAPVAIDSLLAEARRRAGPDQLPSRVRIDYVGPNGMIDPSFAEVEVWFGSTRPREPQDDPARPTGAPVKPSPKRPPPKCHHLVWKDGQWSDFLIGCGTAATMAVRCTVPIVWERAIAKGAPRDAVAKLLLIAPSSPMDVPPRWTFTIDDNVRDVHFTSAFSDDCGMIVEAPDPTVGPDSVADGIDRDIIRNTIGTVKASVRACAEGTRGTVRLAVKVKPDGTTTITVKDAPTEPLGACVQRAVAAAKFPPTQSGGSFTYPFVF